MRFLFLFLFATILLFAKSDESCYSVQLKSFVFKKNSSYSFDAAAYPSSCQLISFSSMNAVRCGCYERYQEAHEEKKKLLKEYPNATTVTTYKYRFAKKKKIEPVVALAIPLVLQAQTEIPAHEETKPKSITPKETLSKENAQQIVPQNDIFIKGSVEIIGQYYLQAPKDKNRQNMTAEANLEVQYNKEDFISKAKVKAQGDFADLEEKENATQRSFLRLDELYTAYDFLDEQINVGKNIRFWGALEVRNITDVFNSSELRADPFYSDKLGAWSASYSHFTSNGELSLITKFYEPSREMATSSYVYSYFPETLVGGVPLIYEDRLISEAGEMRPTIYLQYSAASEQDYALDYAFIFQNGYDSQRYFSQSFDAATNTMQTHENAYLVNKILTYNTLAAGATLFKLEALYTDVITNKEISDYAQLGFGLEHTFSEFYQDTNLGLLLEYYGYKAFESDKRSDLELFELFQNDLFFGGRYTLNDAGDSTLLGGVIFDLDYDEQVYYLEYETRLKDIFKLNFDYRYIVPADDYPTAFKLMGVHERLSLKLGYHF